MNGFPLQLSMLIHCSLCLSMGILGLCSCMCTNFQLLPMIICVCMYAFISYCCWYLCFYDHIQTNGFSYCSYDLVSFLLMTTHQWIDPCSVLSILHVLVDLECLYLCQMLCMDVIVCVNCIPTLHWIHTCMWMIEHFRPLMTLYWSYYSYYTIHSTKYSHPFEFVMD